MISITPWFERKFDFNFPVGMFPIIVERLRGTVPGLEFMLQNIPEEKLSHKDGNYWSIKEQVGIYMTLKIYGMDASKIF